jgi:hypothetical protein
LDACAHLRPNDLLIWKTIEWGAAEGFRRYSLGGAHTFLRKTGGILTPTYRHRLDRTWLHRHNFGETIGDRGRETLRKVPVIDKAIRWVLGKN